MSNTISLTSYNVETLNDALLNVLVLTPAQRKFRNSGKAWQGDVCCDACGKTIKTADTMTTIAGADGTLTLGPACGKKWAAKIVADAQTYPADV